MSPEKLRSYSATGSPGTRPTFSPSSFRSSLRAKPAANCGFSFGPSPRPARRRASSLHNAHDRPIEEAEYGTLGLALAEGCGAELSGSREIGRHAGFRFEQLALQREEIARRRRGASPGREEDKCGQEN
jgi:hypothetical protein